MSTLYLIYLLLGFAADHCKTLLNRPSVVQQFNYNYFTLTTYCIIESNPDNRFDVKCQIYINACTTTH